MYTDDQIIGIAKSLVSTAKRHLPPLPNSIAIRIEAVGDGTFVDTKIGCIARGYTIIINRDWFTSTTSQDIKYLIWHEVRHIYQKNQIDRLFEHKQTHEKTEVLLRWQFEFSNYIPNTPSSEVAHFNQHIEIDAYAFALAMLFIYDANPDGSVDIALPSTIESSVYDQAIQLCYATLPPQC